MNHVRRIALVMAVTILVAACGGSSTAPAALDGSGSDATPPEATAAGDNSGAGGGDAGAAGQAIPDVADALYMTGTAHVEVSGQRTLTADAGLVPGASMTTGGTTLLSYSVGEGQDAVLISISNGPDIGLAVVLIAPSLTTGGDRTTGCAFDVTRNDSSGLAGTFACRGLSTVGLDLATVDIEGSFSAEP
jgi:hypothetical protein